MHQPSIRASQVARRTEWLSLGPAARLLGVDADTLRRWADAGRVEAFTTPGGHRRFSRRAIDRLIASRRSALAVGRTPLGARADRLAAAYRRRATSQPHFRLAAPLDPTLREALRADGRSLVDSLVRFLDAADDVARERIEAEATELAVDLARRLAAADLPLTDAVARFVVAREPLLDGILRAAHQRRLDADRLASIVADASSILDRLLLAFIAAHDAAAAGSAAALPAAPDPSGPSGATSPTRSR